MIKNHQIKIYPNKTMTKVINNLFHYHRYCYNSALETWNDMYDEFLLTDDKLKKPTGSKVRNELVANKEDWQYELSARVLQEASNTVEKAFKNFFNKKMPNHRHPKFKSRKFSKKIFITDRARIVDNKLMLDKPHTISRGKWFGIRMSEHLRFEGKIKLAIVTEKADGLYVSLMIDTKQEQTLPIKQGIAGVDANIKGFVYNDGTWSVNIPKLQHHYERINYYQRLLARKRVENPNHFRTIRYAKVRTKLQREYQKVQNIQKDSLNKFTTMLVKTYPEIHIEDLDVNHMKMSKRMSKNLHRAMFGQFKQMIAYKAQWNERKLVLVNKWYPSTQICSECGFQKTSDSYGGKQTLSGDSIHHQHQIYRCYECGLVIDRDENAVLNLINYRI